MSTNLLSVIEQQQKALILMLNYPEARGYLGRDVCSVADAALAVGKQALEQTQGEAARPDILEKLTYHRFERDDMTLDDCLTYLRTNGWHEVHGRTERQMILQLTELLASAPAYPQATEPAPKRPPNCGTGHCSCIECVMEPAPSTAGDGFDHLRATNKDKLIYHGIADDFKLRGLLAANLKCWHRLTEAESNELVALLSAPALPDHIADAGKLLSEIRDMFPMPAPGSALERAWSEAINYPESVPDYVRACIAALPAAAMPVGELKPVPPNETGATHCVVRWMVETPKGWLGAYDKDAFSAYIAAARTQPVREPLTDEELDLICEKALFCRISFQQFARSIEAAHGIK